jgi:GT2 family glycosyltransferase
VPGNSGFAHAVNLGVLESSTEWVAVINSDARLAHNWLELLQPAAQRTSSGFACGPITRTKEPETIDGTYDLLSRAACPWRGGEGFPLATLRQPATEWLPSFTAILLHRQAFLDLGMLDEGFGSYLEDVDFALRCLRSGVRGVFVCDALATHHGSASFGSWNSRTTRLQSRNQVLLIARHYPHGWTRRAGRAVLAGQALWGLVALRHGVFRSWLLGKVDALRAWRRWRSGSTPLPAEVLFRYCEEAEKTILEWQGDPPRDAFWRWYFRLAGG